MRCELCGTEFEPTALGCQTKCPLGSHCRLICCPNCGYQTVDTAKSTAARLFDRLRALFPHRPRAVNAAPPTVTRLSELPVGTRAVLQSLDALEARSQARLIAFGLTPGCEVELLQRRPAPVVRCDETDLALDLAILEQITISTTDGRVHGSQPDPDGTSQVPYPEPASADREDAKKHAPT
ncbi:MAG: FeoA family protein [bacterium]